MVITPDRFISAVTPPELHAYSVVDTCWFVFQGSKLLTIRTAPDSVSMLYGRTPQDIGIEISRTHYLGRLDSKHCFVAEALDGFEPPAAMTWQNLRSLFGVLDDAILGVAGRALQVLEWGRSHLFCSRCGAPTQINPEERVRTCPVCSYASYPRVSPAMMALICRGRELLLARPPHFTEGTYSALAGFVEPGETLEQTVHREVMEEVGVRVANLQYFASQSWPFPHSLMVAFTCDWVEGEIVTQSDEIEAAAWFDIDALPRLPMKQSIARNLIESTVTRIRSGDLRN